MPSKKDLAVDALMNLHFAERADAEALLMKLVDAFEEIEQERVAAHELPEQLAGEAAEGEVVVPASDDPPVGSSPPPAP